MRGKTRLKMEQQKEEILNAYKRAKPRFKKEVLTICKKPMQALTYKGIAVHKPFLKGEKGQLLTHTSTGLRICVMPSLHDARIAAWRISNFYVMTKDVEVIKKYKGFKRFIIELRQNVYAPCPGDDK